MTATGSVVQGPGGGAAFAKRWPEAPTGFFESEARGLAWLAEAGTVAVPEVLSVDAGSIVLALVPEGHPTALGAAAFGGALADLHAAGAPAFGAPWPGFVGPLAMDNRPGPRHSASEAAAGSVGPAADQEGPAAGSAGSAGSMADQIAPAADQEGPAADGTAWVSFYTDRRVLPFLRVARDRGVVDADGVSTIEQALARLPALAGPSAAEPPSRIHGDLWAGNLLWDPDGRGWLIDPAAHGGHRETDLAMLALFGTAHLNQILAGYNERRPLADDWQERVGLHQLHPLLVHAVLFGPSYAHQAVEVAQQYC